MLLSPDGPGGKFFFLSRMTEWEEGSVTLISCQGSLTMTRCPPGSTYQ
jgi:hypothetical protein